MSHIHLPDGILDPLIWIGAYFLCLLIIGIVLKAIKIDEAQKKIPFIGILAALMLIFMSVPLGIVPVHLSLAVLTGIVAGPAFGFLAVFVVNIILALIGHGGITVVGLNTLIVGSEAVIGYYLFNLLTRRLKPGLSAIFSTIIALVISTSLMLGVVTLTVGPQEALPSHSHDSDIHSGEESSTDIHNDHNDHTDHEESLSEALEEINYLSLTGWAALVAILLVGIFLEAFATSLIVSFFSRVRPDLISRP